MIEKNLEKSKYLVFITIAISMIGALLLYVTSIVTVGQLIYDTLFEYLKDPQSTKKVVVGILKLIDLLLIAACLQILSVGMYKLFINTDYKPPQAMHVNSFGDLKELIVKIASIVLIIVFLEHVVSLGPSQYILELGAAIALVLIAVTCGILLEKTHSIRSEERNKSV